MTIFIDCPRAEYEKAKEEVGRILKEDPNADITTIFQRANKKLSNMAIAHAMVEVKRG